MVGTGRVKMLRMLKSTKDSAIKARTQANNQIRDLIVTASTALRDTLRGLLANRPMECCLGLRPERADLVKCMSLNNVRIVKCL